MIPAAEVAREAVMSREEALSLVRRWQQEGPVLSEAAEARLAALIAHALTAQREAVAEMILAHAARRDPDGHADDISDRAARRLADVVLGRRKP